MIKLVASDLDGTLLNSRKELPSNLASIIKELEKREVIFVVASGRSRDSVISYFGDMPVFIIGNNGGTVYSTEGEILFEESISYEDANPVLEIAQQNSYMHVVLIGRDNIYVQQDESDEHKAFVNIYFNNAIKIVPELKKTFLEDTIVKISISTGGHCRNEERGMKCMEQFKDLFSLVLSGDGWVDLTGKNASKGKALKRLCEKYGISMNETLVFGDYLNDFDMLIQSPNSYAMANAHPEVKKICAHITRSTNDEDGVVKELTDIFNLAQIGGEKL